MLDITDFDQVFRFNPNYTYSQTAYNDILHNRRLLQNQLFFDRLLAVLQVKGSQKYPPHTNQDLRQLHQRIVSAPIPDHHKQSLLFYLLKDCRAAPGEMEPAEALAEQCFLPPKYSICVQGLWEMDRLQFRPALESLTHPSLLPTFSPQILSVLLTHSSQPTPADPDAALLPLAYYTFASPDLSSDPALLSSFFAYLARISLSSALDFVRAQPQHQRRGMLEALARSVLERSPGEDDGETRARRGVELVELPLEEEEEGWVEEFLLEGKGRNLEGAEETVWLRRMARGRVDEVVRMGAAKGQGRRVEGVSWGMLRDGVERGLGGRRNVPTFEM